MFEVAIKPSKMALGVELDWGLIGMVLGHHLKRLRISRTCLTLLSYG